MKFFVPPFQDEETALKNYEGIKKFAQQNLGWTISEKRIFKIEYFHGGKEYVAEVGETDPHEGELISAILESNAYLVCTTNRGVLRGEPILVGTEEIRSMEVFDEVQTI